MVPSGDRAVERRLRFPCERSPGVERWSLAGDPATAEREQPRESKKRRTFEGELSRDRNSLVVSARPPGRPVRLPEPSTRHLLHVDL
ncbi:hypothetical protein JRQ81_013320 [Phrynocephalus forsythii]|uniref:Uncharacterized protein n=1 Tax=Phrynocephalus forsythii TaxID=171643 RepID=A0A9Q0Y1L0_9SAUR|nr:hypothetical protein JRQ81_013320 [Phrynocephalus forsythii]